MPHIALTRACFLTPAVAFLERTGAPVRRLLAAVGLPEWALQDPEGLLPTSAAIRFLDHAARREGIAALGFLAGQERRIDALGVFGRTLWVSPTVGDALSSLVRNHRAFTSHGRVWLRARGADVELCQAFAGAVDDGWAQAEHYLVTLAIDLVRLAAGPEWRPASLQLQTGETPVVRDVAVLADTRIAFGRPASALAVPRALLAAPLRARPAAERLTPRSLEAWHASAPAADFGDAVGQVVATLSWRGYPRIGQTANALGASTRTLQRHLAADGVSHETLVDRVRLATAATLLAKTDARIVDVALDVGYSDHAHFTRAFRRWTGETPMQFRSAHRLPARV
jgi:AraC-like DNA-binding protein